MRRTVRRTAVPAMAVATALVLAAPPAVGAPAPEPTTSLAPAGGREGVSPNGADRNTIASRVPARTGARTTTAASATRPGRSTQAYPRQTTLRTYPADPTDSAIKLGLVPYHEIAPRLNALQTRSDRVSVEVIGESTQGRELYLVTVTSPETSAQVRRQQQLRAQIENEPASVAGDRALQRDYKEPVLFHGNIHGNEYEGTDASLRVIEQLATARDTATQRLLDRTRISFVVTVNPDGRVAGTRANAAGFNLNRDYITASQPETVATRDVIRDTQPLVFLDLHGYVKGTLLEPTTAPHGQNYEYDLYIRQALPNALGMERDLEALVARGGIPDARPGEVDPVIPFRDQEPGDWDDWPPIFTPMYAMFHGSIGHTIEVPLRVNNAEYTSQPAAELQRRSRVNTAVAASTVRSSISYVDRNRRKLLLDQAEQFRRQLAGEPRREVPVGFVPGFGPEDQGYTTRFPRRYVIPVGAGQRSEAAAARLVDHLIANDVRVTRATSAFSLSGTDHPTGSYVVDMRQPKRGLANVMLEAGRDLSDRVPQMYDISGWSHGLLWGATVTASDDRRRVRTRPVRLASPTGGITAPPGSALRLALRDARDVAAANALLTSGVDLGWAADGSVVVPASARLQAGQVAERYGVRLTAAAAAATVPLDQVTVAAAAAGDELTALRDMGFTVRPIDTAAVNAGTVPWSTVDTLYVSSGLSYTDLTPAARGQVDAWLRTGGVVTRGATGAAFNAAAGLLTATAVAGREDANGVVDVLNDGGPVTAGALPHSFVYSPLWFTRLGAEVVREQAYLPGVSPLVAGHWRPRVADGTGGPQHAAGQPSVVRGRDERGASVVMFGTEPLFRDHPKGLYDQVARALYLTSSAPAAAPAP